MPQVVTGAPSAIQAVIFALVQGATELFPVSSVAHGVLLPTVLHWHINQAARAFLPFIVVLHLGTALALLIYFWRDWLDVFTHLHVFEVIVIGTVPAAVIGYIFEHPLRSLFAAPLSAAIFLLVNGAVLWAGDRKRHQAGERTIEDLTTMQAFWVGVWQATALIPGISRSGVTLVASLHQNLKEEEAARLAFLLATPIIAGAGVLEVPKLGGMSSAVIGPAVIGGVVAGIVAYASTAILMRYFRTREINALRPFSIYCWVVGALSVVLVGAGL